jgi:ribonuclease HI
MPDIIDENAVNIYTDGSSYSGPRRGGMGIVYVTVNDVGHPVVEEHQPLGRRGATNNQMELQACIEALDHLMRGRTQIELDRFRKIVIKTDSMYVSENHKIALYQWSANRWRNREGRPVDNAGQWKELLKKIHNTGKRVEIEWVKGHKNSAHNKSADKAAKRSAKGQTKPPLTQVSVRRKLTDKSVERGSVRMLGQELTIHVITCERLRPQRVWKYKYEVMSDSSPFKGNVDVAYSDHALRDGHHYLVRFNDNNANPRILECLEEVDPPTSTDPD